MKMTMTINFMLRIVGGLSWPNYFYQCFWLIESIIISSNQMVLFGQLGDFRDEIYK